MGGGGRKGGNFNITFGKNIIFGKDVTWNLDVITWVYLLCKKIKPSSIQIAMPNSLGQPQRVKK